MSFLGLATPSRRNSFRFSGLVIVLPSCWPATSRAHLQCSRCWRGRCGSSSGCSGTGPRPDSRPLPRSSFCGSPRGPWQRCGPCSRPGHIRVGGARLLIARGTLHPSYVTGMQIFSTMSSREEHCCEICSPGQQHHLVEKLRTKQQAT